MNNSEKIIGLLSGFIKNGILTSKDVKKEILTDLKFRKDELHHKDIAYDKGATKGGLYFLLDKIIQNTSKVAIKVSEKI